MAATMRNTLFHGDNLPILREYIDTESVDLVYVAVRQEDGLEMARAVACTTDRWQAWEVAYGWRHLWGWVGCDAGRTTFEHVDKDGEPY